MVAWRPYLNVVTALYSDIVVFENLFFRPFRGKQEAGVFKNVHSEDGFGKPSFLVSEIAVYVLTEVKVKMKKKISVFKNKGLFT